VTGTWNGIGTWIFPEIGYVRGPWTFFESVPLYAFHLAFVYYVIENDFVCEFWQALYIYKIKKNIISK
jgi:hypothetical protein